jgi:hypothetical protein
MERLIKAIAAKRAKGERAGPLRALSIAVPVGVSAAVIAYKAIRAAE